MSLRFFRKHQKLLLAVFGIAIMIAFLLPSASLRCGSSQGPVQANQTVVEWNNNGRKTLDARELHVLRIRHAAVFSFLSRVVNAAIQRSGTPSWAGKSLVNPQTGRIIHPGISPDNSHETLVLKVLLAEKAMELGLEVNDQAIQQFLNQLSGGTLTINELRELRTQVLHDQLDENELFHYLRIELLSQKMLITAGQFNMGTTPGDLWDYYNRLKREITAEIMPLPTNDYVALTRKPAEDEVSKFYDKYKDREPVPGSPDPGFKRPKQVSLEYIVADMRDYQATAGKTITDEQISTYYEENLDEFKRTEPVKAAEEPAAEEPATEEPATEEPATEEPATSDIQKDPRKAAARPPVPPEAASNGVKETVQQPNELSEADLDLDEPTPNSSSEEDTSTAQPIESDLEVVSSPTDEQPDYGHKPLSEVAELIRANLAIPIAKQQLTDQISLLRKEMRQYYNDYRLYQVNRTENSDSVAPRRPVFQDLAEQYDGMTADIIPLVAQRELVENHEIGRSRNTDNRSGIADDLFSDNLQRFHPLQSEFFQFNPDSPTDHTQKVYILWKTDETPVEVPELESIKAKVIEAWKTREATAKATEEAEKFAKDVNENNRTLQEHFENQSDREVKTIGPFSWYTLMTLNEQAGPQLFLTPVEGIEDIGIDFMRQVFSLRVGQTGTAINRSKKIVYVVRIQSDHPSQEIRRAEFFKLLDESGGRTPEIIYITMRERQQHITKWIRALREEKKLKWNQRPDGRQNF